MPNEAGVVWWVAKTDGPTHSVPNSMHESPRKSNHYNEGY
jgi:hypothetical protein